MTIIFIIAALLIAGAAKGKSEPGGAKKLPPAVKTTVRNALCRVMKSPESLLPTWGAYEATVRELYPSGSWPASPTWTDMDVDSLPPEDRERAVATRSEVERLLREPATLKKCTESKSPYGTAYVTTDGAGYIVRWSYSNRVRGFEPGSDSASALEEASIRMGNLQQARQTAVQAAFFFGSVDDPGSSFAQGWAILESPDNARVSAWRMGSGKVLVLTLRDDPSPSVAEQTVDSVGEAEDIARSLVQ